MLKLGTVALDGTKIHANTRSESDRLPGVQTIIQGIDGGGSRSAHIGVEVITS
jgi:hypothetical protein